MALYWQYTANGTQNHIPGPAFDLQGFKWWRSILLERLARLVSSSQKPALFISTHAFCTHYESSYCCGDRAFCMAAPILWNMPPWELRTTTSTTFMTMLKTHLFRLAFPMWFCDSASWCDSSSFRAVYYLILVNYILLLLFLHIYLWCVSLLIVLIL